MINIAQKPLKLISFLMILSSLFISFALANKPHKSIKIQNSKGIEIEVRLAISNAQRIQGLSGIKPDQFKENEGMLFPGHKMEDQSFWMPDTYFNLDIIFLDGDLKVIAIERNVPHHIGRDNPHKIYRTKTYLAQHVLETKASSEFSKTVNAGDKLKWISTISLSEIVQEIRLWR